MVSGKQICWCNYSARPIDLDYHRKNTLVAVVLHDFEINYSWVLVSYDKSNGKRLICLVLGKYLVLRFDFVVL